MSLEYLYEAKFGYPKNCSLLHFIPDGATANGLPVVIFPKEPAKVVEGKKYSFMPQLTRLATYTIDGILYRVAHAIALRSVDGDEGDFVNSIIHRTAGNNAPSTLADRLSPQMREKFAALAARALRDGVGEASHE